MNKFEFDEILCDDVEADKAWSYETGNISYEILQYGDTFEVYIDGNFQCQTNSYDRAVLQALPMID